MSYGVIKEQVVNIQYVASRTYYYIGKEYHSIAHVHTKIASNMLELRI